jgi:hypothetical protein
MPKKKTTEVVHARPQIVRIVKEVEYKCDWRTLTVQKKLFDDAFCIRVKHKDWRESTMLEKLFPTMEEAEDYAKFYIENTLPTWVTTHQEDK